MGRPIRHPAARADLRAIVERISEGNPDAAEALADEIEAKAARLPENPRPYRRGRVAGARDGGAPRPRGGLPPWAALAAVSPVTTILTGIVTNDALAVVVTPVAIAPGASLGIDPRPLVITVMVGASASFATPIGQQADTLVHGPGGCRFTDHLRIGVPMNLLFGLAACLLIPLVWLLDGG